MKRTLALAFCFVLAFSFSGCVRTTGTTETVGTKEATAAGQPATTEKPTTAEEPITTENTTTAEEPITVKNKQIIVYYPNWNLESKDAREGGEVGSIDWESVTMINHAFFAPYPDGDSTESSFDRRAAGQATRTSFSCVSTLPEYDFEDQRKSAYNDAPRNHFAQYAVFAEKYPDVKIMISVGGATRSGFFSEMCFTKEGRASFIASLVELMREYEFIGGIDIDWEYPAGSRDGERLPSGGGDEGCPIWESAANDNANFVRLLSEMREAFDKEFGVGAKLITACASGSTSWTLSCQTWKAFEPYLDYINVMTYDFAGTWAGVTGHNSPDNLTREAVTYFLDRNVSTSKLNIGAPFYATWLKMSGNTVPEQIVGAPIDANAVFPGDMEGVSDTQRLEAECTGGAGWHMGTDEVAGAVYLYNDDPASQYYMWYASYENPISLKRKIALIKEYELAGIIVWESSQDTAEHLMIGTLAEGLN